MFTKLRSVSLLLNSETCIFIQNPSEIDQNGAQEGSESDPGSKSVPGNPPGSFFGSHFGATWAILGAILDPAGRQGGPKINRFGIKYQTNAKT